MAQWTYYTQPDVSKVGVEFREKLGDRECAANRARQLPASNTYELMRQHPRRDAFWADSDFTERASQIAVPTMLIQGWQDQQVGDRRPGRIFARLRVPQKLIFTNGGHGAYTFSASIAERLRWYDRWLKGEQNGIDRELPAQIWFDTH